MCEKNFQTRQELLHPDFFDISSMQFLNAIAIGISVKESLNYVGKKSANLLKNRGCDILRKNLGVSTNKL